MREILFRGKDSDGVWHKGFYCAFNSESHRIYTGFAETDCGDYYPDYFEVDPDTVGQYTGLTGKNSAKIFEGDIIQTEFIFFGKSKKCRFIIKNGAYIPTAYCKEEFKRLETIGFYADDGTNQMQLGNYPQRIEIIGNIYDNPELLRSVAK